MRKTVHERIKLTDAKVRKMLPPTDRPSIIVWDSDVKRFGVRVTSNGVKSWIVRLKKNGKARQVTIERCELLPIRSFDHSGKDIGARQRAIEKLEELAQLSDGIDLRRQKEALNITFAEIKAEYVVNKRTKYGPLRPNSVRDIENCLTEWDGVAVATITRDMCRNKFNEISATAPTKANRDFRNLRALLNRARELYASENGDYIILQTNPVAHTFRKNGVARWNSTKERDTRIPKEKIGSVRNLLEQIANKKTKNMIPNTCADLVLFLLFTGCRIGEARTLTWSMVDLESKIKTIKIPGSIAKNHNELELPVGNALSTVLMRRLNNRHSESDFVFHNYLSKTGYVGDPRALFKKISKQAGMHIHPHAIRRTYDDIGQIVGVDSDQRRQLQNHKASDLHGKSYSNNPDPEMLLPAVERIGEWILEQGKIAAGENVVTAQFAQGESVG